MYKRKRYQSREHCSIDKDVAVYISRSQILNSSLICLISKDVAVYMSRRQRRSSMHILTFTQKVHICSLLYLRKILLSLVRSERSLAFPEHSHETFLTKFISR